jgi:F0F1-type ATP synthase assembly protein I
LRIKQLKGRNRSITWVKMQEEIKRKDVYVDENREIAMGICLGSGLGIILGAIFNNVMLGLSAGGVVGVLVGIGTQVVKSYKRVK